MEGSIKINASVKLAHGRLEKGSVVVLSNDIGIVGGKAKLGMIPLEIPRLKLNDLIVGVSVVPQKVIFESFTLGDEQVSPFYIDLKGKLDLDKYGKNSKQCRS